MKADRLAKQRATLRFISDGGSKSFIQDEWIDNRRTSDDAAWRGYTFFRLLEAENVPAPYPAAEVHAPRPRSPPSDGDSFELILPSERP